ncbi:uncharacterized protein LOC114541140 [Dendronephthya gigantea]|uniref:uncharacterized protein LOC114541140 n=1 Tax=Dendronephthya gigantea TaxID=151771 RepID=UPI00106DBDC4|nr:uncharacterized protein LOC114541140 [Dendronephthya gigantea]
MNEKLSKDSFPHEVIDWLRKNNFDETVVKGESINGKDFFELEMWMIERMIKGIKEVKRFRTLWSKETSQTFDGNGMPVQSKQPCAIVIDSHTDDAETMTPSHRIANPPSAKIGTTPSCHRMIEPISPEVPTEGSPSNFTVDEIPKTPCSFTATSTRRGRSGEKNVKFGWVQFFEIPDKFSVNVEMGLASKNLNGNQRNEFNRDICTLISTHTRYPTEAERQIIAQKIVAKYPFLKDPKICSTSTEWGSWEQKIKHRMKRLQRNPLKHTQDCKPNTEGESIGTPVVKKKN